MEKTDCRRGPAWGRNQQLRVVSYAFAHRRDACSHHIQVIEAVVPGDAAGGGFPQWNSNTPACRRAGCGDYDVAPSTQASLAVSGDDTNRFLLNVSPDIARQVERTPCLHPRGGVRGSPIAGAILTGGEIDAILDEKPIFGVLARDVVRRIAVPIETPLPLELPDGRPGGLHVELFAVPSKVPLHKEDSVAGTLERSDSSVGIAIGDGASTLLFVPGCAAVTPALRCRFHAATVLFFDATLWRDDEMVALGAGSKTARRMGHMPVAGDGGTLDLLGDSRCRCADAVAQGWEMAFDGMEIML